MTVLGGGGHYQLDHFARPEPSWPLQASIPDRCRGAAKGAVVVAPGASILPPSRYPERLYVAVQRELRSAPKPMAPIGGTLRVAGQCLLLDDRLLVLPARSSASFAADGKLQVRISDTEYLESVIAAPGDRILGSGAGLPAEGELLPAVPWPVVEPVPPRCRPAGRQAVLLNPGPRIMRASGTSYVDPGAGGTAPAIEPAPPPPVTDPADCPPGATISFGLCRDAKGRTVPARNAPGG